MSDPTFASVTADDHVTGEAVALDLPPASLGARMASGLVDVLLTVLVLVATAFVLGTATGRSDAALAHVAVIGTLIAVFLVLPTTVETLTGGRSLGKLAMGLRTVRDDAGPISAQHAFVRSLIGFVEIYAFAGAPAFFAAMLSAKGKRLGDYAAGTYVVRSRVRLQLPAPATMPPGLTAWARTADMAALPTGLALAVRQYLGRQATLDPGHRDELGLRLAEQVATYVAPPPPPGTPPHDYLAAVISSRRERDLARLRRDAALRERLTPRR
ncbi:RDD family protein [Nocardioides sp. Soil805]|uniref:RDD family protein n=1 Tax=Nocardioides sp. Soil805 TaxID=1736416 RepID=UPI0007033765|nr:RDD family protein [Nocardioides sp. Soil805]KRF35476.1 transporter [Nocardioides sp. Soil805]